MHGDAARDVCLLLDVHVAAEHRVVREDHIVAERAVVGHVGTDHQQAAAPDPRHFFRFHRAVHRDVFADHVTVAD